MKKYLLFFLVSLTACSDSTLPRYTVLNKLRVLALVADIPEVNFNGAAFTDTITFTPWISDLYGNGRTLTHSFEWCMDPGVALGAQATCSGNPSRTVEFTDQSIATTATYATPNYTGAVSSFSVNLAAMNAGTLALVQAAFAASTAEKKYNGLAFLFVYTVKAGASESVTTIKRIVYSGAAKATKNSNPTTLTLQRNGSEITSLPQVGETFSGVWSSSDQENYLTYQADGTLIQQTEKNELTWFISSNTNSECDIDPDCTTDGYFQFLRTKLGEGNFYNPPGTAPTGRKISIIGVLRDKRGGLQVKPYYCAGPGGSCAATP